MLNLLFLFILFALITGTATKLINKYVLRDIDPFAFALFTNAVAAVIFLIIALPKFLLPSQPLAWILLGAASILWSMIAVFVLISYKTSDVSIRDPLSQSKIIIALILGLVFLGEGASWLRIIGTVIIFIGITVLIYHPKKRFGRFTEPGVKWTILAAFLSAVVAVVDKAALNYFNVETYGFMVFLGPTLILCTFLPSRTHHVKHLLKTKWKIAGIVVILSAATYYFTLKAFALAEVTLVYPLLQLTTLFTVLGGIFIMKEKEFLWQKIIAVIIILAGLVVLNL